jgi:predicted nuclease with RNAse H fold
MTDSQPTTHVYAGIDVACARNKRLPLCFVARDGARLVPLSIPGALRERIPRGSGNSEVGAERPFRAQAQQLSRALREIAAASTWNIVRIAIDAPAAPPQHGPRNCEKQLTMTGISCFQTPDRTSWGLITRECRQHLQDRAPLSRLPHANRIWMLYGFEIFTAFRGSGIEAVEVYPQSIARTLLGGECLHKSTNEGYAQQLEAVARVTGWRRNELEYALAAAVPGTRHDRLDAFMAAWVATLEQGQRSVYGDENDPDDAIWTPRAAWAWVARPTRFATPWRRDELIRRPNALCTS